MCQMPWVDGDADMLSTVGMPDFGDLEQDCGLTDSVRDEVVCLFTTLEIHVLQERGLVDVQSLLKRCSSTN